MLKWLKGFLSIFQKKQNDFKILETYYNNACENCVWWKAEEENNAPLAIKVDDRFDRNYRFCDIQKNYTHKIHTCNHYLEERFEATEESIQTEEYEIKHELSIEESESSDPGSKQK